MGHIHRLWPRGLSLTSGRGSKRDSGGGQQRWVQAAWPLLELHSTFRLAPALNIPISLCSVLEKLEKECRKVKHILFPSWPDQQTPESAKPLLHLVSKVEETLQTAASPGPIVVHCR